MFQRAISTCGNINVDVALALFDKQLMPILSYGSVFWGICDCYNKLYLTYIAEDIKTVHELNTMLKSNSVVSFKRVGKKKNSARRILATFQCYESKMKILNDKFLNIVCEDFTKSKFESKFEQLQTKFFKFVLNISKFASNHGIRAELGKFPLCVQTDVKLIKYWHRLECVDDNKLLHEAFQTCELNNYSWYQDILSCIKINGLFYIAQNPTVFTNVYVGDKLTQKLKNQYIQIWDSRSKNCDRLKYLYIVKKTNYQRSEYLNAISDIRIRKKITQLRLGCSKLNIHRFPKKGGSLNCQFCTNIKDDLTLFISLYTLCTCS